MFLVISEVKNQNKNPAAEFECKLLQQDPLGGLVSPVVLSVTATTLNLHLQIVSSWDVDAA